MAHIRTLWTDEGTVFERPPSMYGKENKYGNAIAHREAGTDLASAEAAKEKKLS